MRRLKRSDLYWLSHDQIVEEEGFNIRYDYGNIESLAKSIIQHGIKNPLRVTKIKGTDTYKLTDGHRRYRAILRAVELGHTDIKIPVLFDKSKTDADRILGMIIYNDGKTLTMLEEARVYERLKGEGMTQAEIAKKVNKSPMHISNCFLLLTASDFTLSRVKSGEVSASYIVEKLRGQKTKPKPPHTRTIRYDKPKAITSVDRINHLDDLTIGIGYFNKIKVETIRRISNYLKNGGDLSELAAYVKSDK